MGGSYPSAEKQSVYSTAPADWAKRIKNLTKRAKDLGKLYIIRPIFLKRGIHPDTIYHAVNFTIRCVYLAINFTIRCVYRRYIYHMMNFTGDQFILEEFSDNRFTIWWIQWIYWQLTLDEFTEDKFTNRGYNKPINLRTINLPTINLLHNDNLINIK